MKFQRSIAGFIIAGIFAVLAMAALISHLYSVKTNPGDSGESAIVLLPFASPWIFMVPKSVAYSKLWAYGAYVFYILCVIVNATILYILSGGLKIKR